MWHCHYCRASLSLEVQRRNRLCPNCGSDIHCCRNCHHYDENLSSKCKEPESPWVGDRSAQNMCPFFEFAAAPKVPPSSPETNPEAEEAKRAFKALFRNI
jgi:predicted RNA-binding Zn-ribbon protein involved in translation (DUF1610 family)